MKVAIKGTHYVTRAGAEAPPYSVVDVPPEEAEALVRDGIGERIPGEEIRTAMAVGPAARTRASAAVELSVAKAKKEKPAEEAPAPKEE